MSKVDVTKRTRVRLGHELGVYDREVIYQIIDQAPVCHVSTVVDGIGGSSSVFLRCEKSLF